MDIHGQGWGREFEELTRDLCSMMDELQRGAFFRSQVPSSWRPRINAYETPREFVVCVELAGVKREQIDLYVEGRTLHIGGVRAKPNVPVEDEFSVNVMEIDSGRFLRQIAIPPDVDADKTAASFREGYLWIFLPRAAGQGTETEE